MLSQTAEYALRAVLYLANHCDGDQPIPVEEIGRALGIPANYLSKTLNALVREKVLRSSRGPRGGFCLAVSPARLTFAPESLSDEAATLEADPLRVAAASRPPAIDADG